MTPNWQPIPLLAQSNLPQQKLVAQEMWDTMINIMPKAPWL